MKPGVCLCRTARVERAPALTRSIRAAGVGVFLLTGLPLASATVADMEVAAKIGDDQHGLIRLTLPCAISAGAIAPSRHDEPPASCAALPTPWRRSQSPCFRRQYAIDKA
jgi:hypothetical protein